MNSGHFSTEKKTVIMAGVFKGISVAGKATEQIRFVEKLQTTLYIPCITMVRKCAQIFNIYAFIVAN